MSEQTNVGSSGCYAAAVATESFSFCKPGDNKPLFAPGAPEPYSYVFEVKKGTAVGISAWGLCGNDTINVQRVKRTLGKMGQWKKCQVVCAKDAEICLVQPFNANCKQVCLSECNDYIVLDRPGEYRLCWADGACGSIGDVLVELVDECVPVPSDRRGY